MLRYVSIHGKPLVKLPAKGLYPVHQKPFYAQEEKIRDFQAKLCTELLSLFTDLGAVYTGVLHSDFFLDMCESGFLPAFELRWRG